MTEKDSLESALEEAIATTKPTAPPTEIAESLRSLSEKHDLSKGHTVELITGFFAHFDIDPSGEAVMVILRSGYQIPADGDVQQVVDHLRNAIVGESTRRFTQTGSGDWAELWGEIAAEVEHVAYETHHESVRALLAHLLLEAAQAHWGKLVNELFPFLEVDSVPPPDIPSFLKTAKKKLVLLLGWDSGDGFARLQQIKEYVEQHGYHCVLIKELPEHSELGLIGKVLFTALSARFVIVECREPHYGPASG